ncbi:hypothetical protein ABPG75_001772 [Micractinium tetrahymenae]
MGLDSGMYDAMQAVLRFWRPELPLPAYEPFDSGANVLKVVIEHRTTNIRNIINWEELVQRCNEHRDWGLPPDTPIRRVQCRAATFGLDVLANLAAVGQADVLVAVHGAGIANWLAMPEGSALVEIRPFDFGSADRQWADLFFQPIPAANDWRLQWWAINIEDPALSEPSQREKDGLPPGGDFYHRDRHTRLPFDSALVPVLQRIAAVGRDRERYLAARAQQAYAELKPGGKLQAIPL